MQHAVFIGDYDLTIDPKNRLLVPAEVRRKFDPVRDGKAFLMVVGSNRKLWLYPKNYYESLVSQVPQDITPDDDLLAFNQLHFAMASEQEWDKQGRILINDKTLRRTGLGKEVTLIGSGNHLQLWNRAEWEQRYEELLSRSTEITLKARQARSAGDKQT
jgi:MraZ protein